MWENKAFFFSFYFPPAWCKLTGWHRALFEVLCEHKSLLIKVPHSENDLNKHSPKIIPSLGSSNLPQNGGWGLERLEEALGREYLRTGRAGVAERSHLLGVFVQSALEQQEWLHFQQGCSLTSASGGVTVSLYTLSPTGNRMSIWILLRNVQNPSVLLYCIPYPTFLRRVYSEAWS